jgi:hypothetical protein
LFETIKVLQKEQPRGLFGIIKFSGAASFFPEDIIDVLERLFEHAAAFFSSQRLEQSFSNPGPDGLTLSSLTCRGGRDFGSDDSLLELIVKCLHPH